MLTRLGLGFSHPRDQKFRHDFQSTLNPSLALKMKPQHAALRIL